MAQYIPKSALVAEIKARINDIEEAQKAGIIKKRDADMKIILFKSILSLINTLEVKEVDLEKEVIDWWNTHYPNKDYKDYAFKRYTGHYLENSTVINIAKHFFELGMSASNKAQKGK